MIKVGLGDNRLPLDYPASEARLIYAKRLGVFLAFSVANLLLLSLALMLTRLLVLPTFVTIIALVAIAVVVTLVFTLIIIRSQSTNMQAGWDDDQQKKAALLSIIHKYSAANPAPRLSAEDIVQLCTWFVMSPTELELYLNVLNQHKDEVQEVVNGHSPKGHMV